MSLIIPANTLASGGYEVANSLRFNSASDDYLKRTPSSSGNRKTWTWSSWVKKAARGSDNYEYIFNCTDASTTTGRITSVENAVDVFDFTDDLISLQLRPNALNRDFSAWYNLVVALDTTQGTAANRVKMYVNGEQITSFATANYPDQNVDGTINLVSGSYAHHIGSYVGTTNFFNGYMAELCFIDGTALGADSFGEFDEDSGIWKPIDVSGLTFGTNGFYLETKQSGTSQNSSGLGADTSGNDNHFAVNNLTAVDQSTDTCTNNFATMNPLDGSQYQTLSEGNLKIVNSSAASSFGLTKGSIGVTKGKWYWEVKYTYGHAGHFGFFKVSNTAITNEEDINGNLYTVAGSAGNFTGVGFRISGGGDILEIEGNVDTNVDFSSGDTLGLAFDGDSGKLYAFKNGAELTGQDIGAGTSLMAAVTMDDIFLPFVSNGDGGSGTKTGTSEFNFGSPPYAISSGNQDGNGFGNFEYAVPSGYFSINTKNLAEHG